MATKSNFPICAALPESNQGGIYSIVNNSSGKIYIGSAVSIRKRWNGHRHFFQRGTQENQYLQRAFDKEPESFEFFVVEELKNLSKENMLSRVQFWMDFYESYVPESGYNLSPKAGSCRGMKMSDEAKIAMSKKLKGRKLSPEHCLNIGAAVRRRIRKPLTDEQRARIKAGVANCVRDLEALSRAGKKAGLMKIRWRPVIQLDSYGNEIQRFDSIKIASEQIGWPQSRFNIGAVCRGERPKALGYGWKYG